MAFFWTKVVGFLLFGNFFVDEPILPSLDMMMKILFGFKTYTGITHMWPLLLTYEPDDPVLPQLQDWAFPALGCLLYGLSYMALYYYWNYTDTQGEGNAATEEEQEVQSSERPGHRPDCVHSPRRKWERLRSGRLVRIDARRMWERVRGRLVRIE